MFSDICMHIHDHGYLNVYIFGIENYDILCTNWIKLQDTLTTRNALFLLNTEGIHTSQNDNKEMADNFLNLIVNAHHKQK